MNKYNKFSGNFPQNFDAQALKAQAESRIDDVLRDLCGVPDDAIQAARAGNKREFPCPRCGGSTRFRVLTDAERDKLDGRPVVRCSHRCFDGKETADVFGAIRWANGCGFKEAVQKLAELLNGDRPGRGVAGSIFDVMDAKPATAATTKAKIGARPQNVERRETAVYPYFDESGAKIAERVRVEYFDRETGKRIDKTFFPYLVDAAGNRVVKPGLNGLTLPPYNLPRLLDKETTTVFIVEGEKCADAVQRLFDQPKPDPRPKPDPDDGREPEKVAPGYCATTFGGAANAGRWKEYASILADKANVYICADNDDPGRKASETAARALTSNGVPCEKVFIADFPERFDGTPAPTKTPKNGAAPDETSFDVADLIAELEAAETDPGERLKAFFHYVDGHYSEWTNDDEDENAADSSAASPCPGEEETPTPDEKESDPVSARRLELAKLDAVPEFPFDAMPPALAEYCGEVARARKAPSSVPCLLALAAFGATVGKSVVLDNERLNYFDTVGNIYAMILADSGTGKSEVLTDCLFPIFDRQQAENARIAEAKKTGGAKPYRVRYRVTDVTPEGVARDLCRNCDHDVTSAAMLALDEASRLFGAGAAHIGDSSAYFSQWTQLADGTVPEISRKGDEEGLYAKDKVCLSIAGCIQPDVMARLKAAEINLSSLGYLSRFTWSYYPLVGGLPNVGEVDRGAKERYRRAFEKATQIQPTRLRLSEKAFGVLLSFLADCDPLIQRARFDGDKLQVSFVRKAAITASRCALLFRVADWASNEPGAVVQTERDAREDAPLSEFATFEEGREVFDAINPIIDAETMSRAVAVARWSIESFQHVSFVLAVEEKNGKSLKPVSSPLFDKIIALVEAIEDETGRGATIRDVHRSPGSPIYRMKKPEKTALFEDMIRQGFLFGDDRLPGDKSKRYRSTRRLSALQKAKTKEIEEADDDLEEDADETDDETEPETDEPRRETAA